MIFKKKEIRIRRYRKDYLKTYKPKERIGLREGETVSLFFRLGYFFLYVGGLISFFASSLLVGIRSFFGIKKKFKKLIEKIYK